MKKTSFLSLVLAMVLSLCACGAKTDAPSSDAAADTQAATGKAVASQYEYTLDGEQMISDLVFENTVTVKGDNGRLIFSNCEFKKDIVNNGGEGAIIILDPSCTVSGKLVVDSSLKEATQETTLPKFMVFCPGTKAEVTACGAVVSSSDLTISINGNDYDVKDAAYFVNEATGEFAEYTGQEAQYHNVAMWNEGGSDVLMHVAVFSQD